MALIEALKKRLLLPLPGQMAHAEMLHLGRFTNPEIPEQHKRASVLILLFHKENNWSTVLMKRSSRFKNDKHKGQISFPGGQSEAFDKDDAATAIRETEEEIGVPSNDIQILGKLSELYIPVSNFLVCPYVGYYSMGIPSFIPEANEVAQVIETKLDSFFEESTRKTKNIELPSGFVLENVPYFDIEGHVVWGATSMIISEFIHILNDSGFKSHSLY